MRKARAVLVCFLLAGCQAAPPKAVDSAEIRNAIDLATARLSRGFEMGQMDSAATVLTEDHFSMPPNGPAVAGRSAWLAWTKAMMVGGQWTSVTTPEARYYGDSLTVDRGRYVNIFVPAAGSTVAAVSDTGKYVWLWKKTSSGWQLAEAIWNSNAAPRP